jgi:predicted amidohydrolase YtcJ
MEKLGDAQLEDARRAGKTGDYNAVGMTLEKYRDNVRAALEALKKQHPDAEKQSNGYRQLQMHVRKGIREVDETLLVSPEGYQPPLQIVRQDLIGMEEELLKMLFPRRPVERHAGSPPAEKQP